MPSAARNDVPVSIELMGYQGRFSEWGDFTVAFEKIPAGEFDELFSGLPDDRCQCPHYGVLLTGKMTIKYADREETVTAGQAYYMAPGHLPRFDEDCETVEFSPTAKLQQTLAVIQKNVKAMQTA